MSAMPIMLAILCVMTIAYRYCLGRWWSRRWAGKRSRSFRPRRFALCPARRGGHFSIACTIPIALFVGLYMYKIRKGRVVEASLIGALLALVGDRGRRMGFATVTRADVQSEGLDSHLVHGGLRFCRGRTGGAVTLAVGMAEIFDKALSRFASGSGATLRTMWKY